MTTKMNLADVLRYLRNTVTQAIEEKDDAKLDHLLTFLNILEDTAIWYAKDSETYVLEFVTDLYDVIRDYRGGTQWKSQFPTDEEIINGLS